MNLSNASLSTIELTNHLGHKLAITSATISDGTILLSLEKTFNFPANYQININGEKKFCYLALSFLNNYFYSNEPLGLSSVNEQDILQVWSPNATKIEVEFKNPTHPSFRHQMRYLKNGVWTLPILWNISNQTKYKLWVTAFGKTAEALDPYAKGMETFAPSGDTLQTPYALLVKPPQYNFPDNYRTNNDISFIGYELHVRDFSIDPKLDIPKNERGTYLGLSHSVAYLKDLGITHVQIMPLQSFYTVNEKEKGFQGEDRPSDKINYNWGYDPHNYFTPDG